MEGWRPEAYFEVSITFSSSLYNSLKNFEDLYISDYVPSL